MKNRNYKRPLGKCLILAFMFSTGFSHAAEHQHNHEHHVGHEHGKITQKPVFKITPPKGKIKEIVPAELIPEAPILNLKDALKSFQVHEDFDLEVIASEPLVFDPVIAIYDAKGRLWVVEMTTYMPDIEGNGEMEHESQIVMLTDTNNDGKMDKRHVILEKLLLPRALAFVDKGILWADHTTLYFSELEDKDGQVKVVKTDVIDKGYAFSGSVEHKPNAMLYSLDNWYYNAYSTSRYRAFPLNAKLPKASQELYRNNHWKMVKLVTEYRGQWGLTQDDYGRHYFNGNSSPIRTTSFIPNVANRNVKHQFPVDLLEQDVGNSNVYPIRVTPALYGGDLESSYRGDSYKLARHTAACGTLVYRGNQFPEQYYGIGLVQEPTANLVKATKITDKNGIVSGEDLFKEREILASLDERFRPVNASNSPDGTITLVDFYHGIIQHGKFMTPHLYNQIKMRDLERHKHIGRLYRLKSKQAKTNNITDISNLSAADLVPYLAHANGWHRDTAQQLLVMKQDKSVVNALTKMANSSDSTFAKVKALWVLEGLNRLSLDLLKNAASHGNEKVKTSVYRLAEQLPTTDKLVAWLTSESEKVSKEASNNLALAAGIHKAWQVIANVINQHQWNDFVMASLGGNEANFLKAQSNNIPETAKKEITTVMNFVDVSKGKKKLGGRALNLVKLGQKLYSGAAGCAGCHGLNGEGSKSVPPLNKSEWVIGDKAKLIAIIKHGYIGPITVRGKTYNSGMIMPAAKHNKSLGNHDIAAVASFIRYAWANEAPAVSPWNIIKFDKVIKQEQVPFNEETLKALNLNL